MNTKTVKTCQQKSSPKVIKFKFRPKTEPLPVYKISPKIPWRLIESGISKKLNGTDNYMLQVFLQKAFIHWDKKQKKLIQPRPIYFCSKDTIKHISKKNYHRHFNKLQKLGIIIKTQRSENLKYAKEDKYVLNPKYLDD